MEFGATQFAEQFWRGYSLPARGQHGGRCNNALCPSTGATWYNLASGRYYCEDCARSINAKCFEQSRRPLCEARG